MGDKIMNNTLYIVIPCYNEEKGLRETIRRLFQKIRNLIDCGEITDKSRILFVDDCSKDSTWEIICQANRDNKLITGIKLSHNRGQQIAIYAGLMEANKYADFVITMDADLQDDIEVMHRFIEEYKNGMDVVYGLRSIRDKDSFIKRSTAQCYYKIINRLGIEIIYNHAEYRLMSKRVLNALANYHESHLFLRGIIPDIGFNSSIIEYPRNERFAGATKYTPKKMINLALDGITSFTDTPLKIALVIGLIFVIVGIIALIVDLFVHFQHLWTIFSLFLILGGINIFFVGVMGIYIGRILDEARQRPRYFVDQNLNNI